MCLGIPGQVEEMTGTAALERTAMVNFGGIRREVNLSFLPEAEPGDYVIVHVGFAISRIDETEAKRIYRYLEELEEEVSAGSQASS